MADVEYDNGTGEMDEWDGANWGFGGSSPK